MAVRMVDPDGSLHPVPYHHVAIGTGTRQVFLAGQTARPAEGGSAADLDLAAQVSAALRQVSIAVAGAGGSFADVVRLTCYVVDWSPASIDPFTEGITAVVEELGIPDPWPPLTVIGVAALWQTDLLVEIEANAVLD